MFIHVVKFIAWQIWVHFFYNSVVELEEIWPVFLKRYEVILKCS